MSRVSVIMPLYNAELTVRASIDSILAQSFSDFDFLIVDDASTDGSAKIVESYNDPRIQLFRNKENLGSLKSRNRLFSKVTGDYIVFQDADDYSELNRIEELVNYMDTNKSVYLCGSNARFFDNKKKEKYISSKPTNSAEVKEGFKSYIPIIFASSIVRSEVLSHIGAFNEFFFDLGNYDYDWMYRISDKYKCANVDSILYNVNRRESSNSVTYKNPYKIIGHKIVQFLAKEREQKGTDSLILDDLDKIKQFAKQEYEPYRLDPSLYLFNLIVGLMGERMYSQAQRLAFQAIRINPKKIKNYRTYLYILRKRLLNIFQSH